MAFTQADLDSIDYALASGELTVKFSDREVVYRSIAELKTARAFIESQLSPKNAARSRMLKVKISDNGLY